MYPKPIAGSVGVMPIPEGVALHAYLVGQPHKGLANMFHMMN